MAAYRAQVPPPQRRRCATPDGLVLSVARWRRYVRDSAPTSDWRRRGPRTDTGGKGSGRGVGGPRVRLSTPSRSNGDVV